MMEEKLIIWLPPKEEIAMAAQIFNALNHPFRRKIVALVGKLGSVVVDDILTALNTEQTVMSYHLRILRNAGILVSEPKGKFRHYRINPDRIIQIKEMVAIVSRVRGAV